MQHSVLISQHPCSKGASARVRKSKSKASQGQARQTKSNNENWYVIKVKVMNEHSEGGQVRKNQRLSEAF